MGVRYRYGVVTDLFHDGWSWFGAPDGGPTVDGLDRSISNPLLSLDQSTDLKFILLIIVTITHNYRRQKTYLSRAYLLTTLQYSSLPVD
jgi:hypothetical protein